MLAELITKIVVLLISLALPYLVLEQRLGFGLAGAGMFQVAAVKVSCVAYAYRRNRTYVRLQVVRV